MHESSRLPLDTIHRESAELFPHHLRTIIQREVSAMLALILWCILFVLCWPLALFALILYPFVWLVLLPFRLLGNAVHGVLALVREIFMLPVRLMRAPFRV